MAFVPTDFMANAVWLTGMLTKPIAQCRSAHEELAKKNAL
jgi:hypothetical protein